MEKGTILLETATYEGVIFSDPYLSDWTPSIEIINQFESGFEQYILDFQEKYEPKDSYEKESLQFVIDNLNEYKRQYYGIKEKGRKIVYCNLLLIDDHWIMNWKEELIEVNDGGPRFFSIEYEVKKNKYSYLMINGRA